MAVLPGVSLCSCKACQAILNNHKCILRSASSVCPAVISILQLSTVKGGHKELRRCGHGGSHIMISSTQRTSHVLSNYSVSSSSLRLPSLGDLSQCAQFLMLLRSSGLTTQSQHQLCLSVYPPFFFFPSSVAPHNFGVRGTDVRTTSFIERQHMLLQDGGQQDPEGRNSACQK